LFGFSEWSNVHTCHVSPPSIVTSTRVTFLPPPASSTYQIRPSLGWETYVGLPWWESNMNHWMSDIPQIYDALSVFYLFLFSLFPSSLCIFLCF
jgi:hypothetical protein